MEKAIQITSILLGVALWLEVIYIAKFKCSWQTRIEVRHTLAWSVGVTAWIIGSIILKSWTPSLHMISMQALVLAFVYMDKRRVGCGDRSSAP